MALQEDGEERLWCARFLAESDYRDARRPVSLKAGNQRSIQITENPEHHNRTKHIEIGDGSQSRQIRTA